VWCWHSTSPLSAKPGSGSPPLGFRMPSWTAASLLRQPHHSGHLHLENHFRPSSPSSPGNPSLSPCVVVVDVDTIFDSSGKRGPKGWARRADGRLAPEGWSNQGDKDRGVPRQPACALQTTDNNTSLPNSCVRLDHVAVLRSCCASLPGVVLRDARLRSLSVQDNVASLRLRPENAVQQRHVMCLS
jgi:hypothetical protein